VEPVAELSGATKRYGVTLALDGVDLAIPAGQVVAVLGPNGAGKTTAISLLLGLRRPTAGRARLFGLDPRDRRARSRCGAMLQDTQLPGQLKVRELIDLFRSYYPAPLPRDDILEVAGLAERTDALVGGLSGGQKQRLQFGLAVCGDPDLLFLDEPSVGMDVEARRAFWDRMRGFAEAGRTILLTTHYLEEADALAERIVVVQRGRIVADAPPAALKARVGDKRVSFLAEPPLGPEAFADLPVRELRLDDGRVRFSSPEPERVLRELFARGAALRDLEVAGVGLEDAILALGAEP
jgi:ABC-2 type transport system ATP-binding protein